MRNLFATALGLLMVVVIWVVGLVMMYPLIAILHGGFFNPFVFGMSIEPLLRFAWVISALLLWKPIYKSFIAE
jgi:hypothetical protein